jgi:CubicO group peptidase (beta-lactamase class C family)
VHTASPRSCPRGRLLIGLLVILAVGLVGGPPAAAVDGEPPASAPGDDAPIAAVETGVGAAAPIARIEAHVADGLRANRVPGAALAIVDGDGQVHLRGFGETGRGGQPVTPDTPFVIGSVSKSMTALAVLQLVEEGLVDLDDPVVRHVEGFEVLPTAWSEEVTVRRLLEHTSGLPPLAGAPATTWMSAVPIAEAAAQVNGAELADEPGTAWTYTNANYVLLGALIEEVTGRPYAEQLAERLFAPLGMTRTTARLGEARALGLADGHRYVLGLPVAHLTFREGLVPAGLVVSTARDLSRYLQALGQRGELDGVRVLSEVGVETLFAPAAEATLGPWAKQHDASYGFGWFTGAGPFGETPVVFHPGASPDFGAMAAMVPATGQALVLLVNVGPRVAIPGAAGDVDRIGAGAVSLLTGSEPADEGSVVDAYGVATPVLVLVVLFAVVLAVRRPRLHHRVRDLAVGGVLTVGGVAVLALPMFDLGWRQNWLWAPDLTAFAALTGGALLVAGARRLLALRSQRQLPDAAGSGAGSTRSGAGSADPDRPGPLGDRPLTPSTRG